MNIETQAAIAAEKARDRATERFHDGDYLPLPEEVAKPTLKDRFYTEYKIFEEFIGDALDESLEDEHICKLFALLQLARDNEGNRDQEFMYARLGELIAANADAFIDRVSERYS